MEIALTGDYSTRDLRGYMQKKFVFKIKYTLI